MASLAAAAASTVTVPSCSGLRVEAVPKQQQQQQQQQGAMAMATVRPAAKITASASSSAASWQGGVKSAVAAAAAAALLLSGPAMAAKVEVGDEVGSFKFVPDTVTVAAGEAIEFTLVGEVGHNIIFDTDGVPSPVAAELAAASMGENDLLSEDEPTHTSKISTPGTYTYYCTPHKSANMKGTIIVK